MNNIKFRLIFFLIVAILLLTLEFIYIYRARVMSRKSRWPANLLMITVGTILVNLVLPVGLFEVAVWANKNNIGLFNKLQLPQFLSAILTFIIFDLAIYFQHVYSHKWSLLWRFHRVHHTDPDLDFTTALRFHPVEILLSLVFKIGIAVIIGANPMSLLVFEIVLNAMSMFNHANIYIPEKIERYVRFFFVTPQMHIIHHSILKKESDTNFGFNFSVWDYLFNSYKSKFTSEGIIGQENYSSLGQQKILYLLKLPFVINQKKTVN